MKLHQSRLNERSPGQSHRVPAGADAESARHCAAHHSRESRSANGIFVLGPPRSGTTLVRLMLNAHPQVCAPDEVIFFREPVFAGDPKRWRESDVPPDALRQFVEHLAKRLPGVTEAAAWTAIDRSGGRDPRSVFLAIMWMLADAAGKPRWAEKTPGHVFFADLLVDMFPEAKFVLVERDPRATVSSMNHVRFYPADTTLNALNLKHYLAWMRWARRVLPAENCYTARYEDLLSDPGPRLRALCDFLELDYRPSMLAFHVRAADAMQPTAASEFNRRATGPLDPANAQRWNSVLTRRDLAVIERVLGPETRQGGYASAGSRSELRLAERLELIGKTLYWHLNRHRRRQLRCFQQRDVVLFRTRTRLAHLAARLGLPARRLSRRGRSAAVGVHQEAAGGS